MNPVVPLHGMLLGSTWPHKQPKMQAGMETSFATSANGTGNPLHPQLCRELHDVKCHCSGYAPSKLSPSFSLMHPNHIVKG